MRIDSEKLKEKYLNLPTPMQDFLSSNQSAEVLQTIRKKYGLHVDDLGAVSNEMMYTIVGLESANNLVENLRHHAHLSEETANAVAKLLDEGIFQPIRNLAQHPDPQLISDVGHDIGDESTGLDATGIGELKTQLPESAFSKAPKKAATLPLDAGTTDTETVEQPAAEAPTQPAAPSIEAARLSGETGLPKTEREIDKLVKEKLPPKQAPSDQATTEHSSPSDKPADGIDPYREPIS